MQIYGPYRRETKDGYFTWSPTLQVCNISSNWKNINWMKNYVKNSYFCFVKFISSFGKGIDQVINWDLSFVVRVEYTESF